MTTGYVLIPARYLRCLEEAVRLDWDYVGGGKVWKLAKDQRPNVEVWSADRLTALRVIDKLEK